MRASPARRRPGPRPAWVDEYPRARHCATATAGPRGIRSSTRSKRTTPSTSTPSRSYAARGSAKSRSTCTTTTTRPPICRDAPEGAAAVGQAARLAHAQPRNQRTGVRVHSRQLALDNGPRRSLLRREQRTRYLRVKPAAMPISRSPPPPARPRRRTSIKSITRWTIRDGPGRTIAASPVGPAPRRRALMLIQGPLLLDWRRRRGVVPSDRERVAFRPVSPRPRPRQRLARGGSSPTPPDWFFVKLHTHGAPEHDQPALLGAADGSIPQALAHRARPKTRISTTTT